MGMARTVSDGVLVPFHWKMRLSAWQGGRSGDGRICKAATLSM